MTENDPQLPEDIRQALKKSPTFTPPESFYRGVLDKIERKRPLVPWYFGYPMKGLATGCVLVMLVVVTRETRRTRPGIFQSKLDVSKEAAVRATKAVSGVRAKDKGAPLDIELAGTKEVQSRLNRSISGMVDNPSPFEEEDAKLRRELNAKADEAAPALMAPASAPALRSRVSRGYIELARDTVGGVAGQGQEWKGDYSGVAAFRAVVVKSPAEWEALWKDHTSYIVPPPPVPDVDFRNQMIVGIFDGTQSSTGYGVTVLDASTRPGNVVVTYRETHPPAGMAAAAVLTQPFHLRVIPKSSLPVVFEKVP